MCNQTRKQLSKLIEQFPAIAQIRGQFKWENEGLTHLPYTHAHVQKPDPEVMNTKGHYIHSSGSAYVMGPNNKRGTRSEYVFAVGFDENILGFHWWNIFEKTSMDFVIQDIFSQVESSKVNYLVWATFHLWCHPTSEELEMSDKYFGKIASAELLLIVYPKPKDKSWDTLTNEADDLKEEKENSYLRDPKEMPELPSVHKALIEGALIHGFLSGGGLRVVAAKNNDIEVGYGEHPYLEEALKLLDEDILNGPRPYGEVYGGTHPHYLTGSTFSSSNIDHWVRQGQSIDCWYADGKFVCRLNGYTHYEMPDWVRKQSKENPEVPVTWEARGLQYTAIYRPFFFANGEEGWELTAEPETDPEKRKDAFFYAIYKVGSGENLWIAMLEALKAQDQELIQESAS